MNAIDDLFKELHSSKEGLSSSDAKERLEKFGFNRIEEKRRSAFVKLLGYFWGPIPWMIEAACILSLIAHHFAEFYIILTLLCVNSLVDFWEEFQAGNAIEALKKKLAPKCTVKRDSKWHEMDAHLLVPGDIVKVKLGNIIPADATLIEGDYLSVDQSTMTGESLPVSKMIGDIIYSGTIAKQGEMTALVTATGKNSFFGKTTKLVEGAKPISHFQRAILQIGNYLIYISLSLAILLIAIQWYRGDSLLVIAQFVLVLLIASIPVAMPAVLSVTMALGALALSKMKAVVTRLESIEEMAGIDILCADKTGTLTQNRLTLGEPAIFSEASKEEAILYAALASEKEGGDTIDLALFNGLKEKGGLQAYKKIKFTPFDPVSKKASATIQDREGKTFYVTKGAPQVILSLCNEPINAKIDETITAFAKKGYRTLGVAKSRDNQSWEFIALLPLFDPLREDSYATIKIAQSQGIKVKMLTGDNLAIASEIASQLEIAHKVTRADELIGDNKDEIIEKSDCFAEVFPEHKYEIVKALQKKGHLVAMTGDGVNDAPALKQAEVGIAVSGATDAARSSSSLVLLESGLNVILKAIEEARKIFERMMSYAIYRIAETIRVMLFMVACILIFNFYPVTPVMIILLALLNDIPILSIVFDNVLPQANPVRWEMKKTLFLSTAIGIVGIVSSFILLIIARDGFHLSLSQIQSFIFLKLSLAGHQTLFIARTKRSFFFKPYPSPILLCAILSTQVVAAFIVKLGLLAAPISWSMIGLIWGYTLLWMFVADGVKLLVYQRFSKRAISLPQSTK